MTELPNPEHCDSYEKCPFCKRWLDDPCEGPEDLRVCAFTPSTTEPIGLRQNGQYVTTRSYCS